MVGRCDMDVKIPADARVSEPYWHRAGEAGRYTFDADAPFGLPYRPTAFRAQLAFEVGGPASSPPGHVTASNISEEIVDDVPVEFRYEGNIFSGEKRTELLVVPEFSVRVSPDIAIVPVASLPALPTVAGRPVQRPCLAASAGGIRREVRVTVMNDGQGAAESVVRLDLPKGWSATPRAADHQVRASGRIADGAVRDQAGSGHRAGRVSRARGRLVRHPDVRPRVSDDRIPAHPAAAHLSRRRRQREGHQRQDRSEPDGSATSSASATRCRRRSSSSASKSSS